MIRFRKIIGLIIVGAILFVAPPILAQNCPSRTTVKGTSITFVGGVADMGGDSQAIVWFEYGLKSGNYTHKTEEKALTKTGKYCITVSNLKPCTTYYYRAAMRNQAGPSYGAEQSRTTVCSNPAPKKVLGAATGVSTGIGDNLFKDSLFIPLIIIIVLFSIFKLHIVNWEVWFDKSKVVLARIRSDRLLRFKVARLRAKIKKNKL